MDEVIMDEVNVSLDLDASGNPEITPYGPILGGFCFGIGSMCIGLGSGCGGVCWGAGCGVACD